LSGWEGRGGEEEAKRGRRGGEEEAKMEYLVARLYGLVPTLEGASTAGGDIPLHEALNAAYAFAPLRVASVAWVLM
jgi:hypothetical protein